MGDPEWLVRGPLSLFKTADVYAPKTHAIARAFRVDPLPQTLQSCARGFAMGCPVGTRARLVSATS